MGHPTPSPPPPPPIPSSPIPCQVRCAGCRTILNVGPGVSEFVCPNCKMPQMLPPELTGGSGPVGGGLALPPQPFSTPPSQPAAPLIPPMPPQLQNRPPVQAHGIDPTKVQLPCANCKAILNVPHGLSRFACPQCAVELFLPPRLLPEEVNEVAIDLEREEDEGGLAGETFTDYRPSKLSIGSPHPDPVVETSSLSAVQPPEPTYNLHIKDDLEKHNTLSCLQIETLIYASQRHLQHLENSHRAGFFLGDGAGVGKGRTVAGLIWENWHHGRKKALWISVGSDLKFDARRDLDDVGASCIEVHPLNKVPYSKLDSKSVGIKEGVIFLTYSSLIASSEKGRSRLQQLVQWCGIDYDGLIVFDECHKAKNLVPEAGSQPTRTGEAVLEIQARLPDARVIYCSATGASEPRNMGYMVRLGLWGAGTSFADFPEFLGALEKGGVGTLELVAMDMKARGMYVCRTLSYKGAEFEVIEAPLGAKMTEVYKKAAEFWAELRVELLSANTFLTEEKPNPGQLWRLYWASHQRFFRHICMSAKVPSAVRLAKQALEDNKCVVIGLQSTGEARTEEAVSKYGVELDDFISGPRELLLKFVDENYPLPDQPEQLQEEGNVKELQRKRHSATPDVSFTGRVRKTAKLNPSNDDDLDEESETDSAHESDSDDEFQICDICNTEEERRKLLECSCCARLVHPSCLDAPMVDMTGDWSCISCKEKTEEYIIARRAYDAELLKRYNNAVERKSKILEIVRSLDLPNNPLDDLIDQLGGPDNVAEITGRRGMLVRASGGKSVTYQARNTKEITMEMVNMHEKQLFMDGKKLIAIISEAGSAGVSLQADRRALNQKRRVHITIELPWSADRAIQQFGRTHRSNQASAPEYRLLFTNLGGERRFASIVAKRLETLGALTQGDRRAGPSLSAYNYDSAYGKKALVVMYRGILEQDSLPVIPPGCSSEKPESIQDFLIKAKAALISVGIVRDAIIGNEKEPIKFSGRIVDSDMHDVGRFLNRLLGLPPEIQNRLFELFSSVLDLIIQKARLEGEIDSGIVTIKANVIELQGTPKTVHVDTMSGASTVLFSFVLDRGITWESAASLLNERQQDRQGAAPSGFYESKREWMGRRHFILAFEGSTSGMFRIFRPAVGEALREMPLAELRAKYRKISSLEKARTGWEDEYEVSFKQADQLSTFEHLLGLVEWIVNYPGDAYCLHFRHGISLCDVDNECMHGPNCKWGDSCTVGRRRQEVHILGGLVLPVWGTIAKALSKQARTSHKRVRVVSIETTTDNRRTVGLLVPNAAVETVLQDLAWIQGLDD